MNHDLTGKRVAILMADGFEQSEFEGPCAALLEAGANTAIVSPNARAVTGWSEISYGDAFGVDVPLQEADERDFDALLLPGGVMNPDKLRTIPEAVEFVREMFEAGKPVAAICHGPQLLIEAGVVRGRRLTSYPSLKTDLINAGAKWVDEAVVIDDGLVTGRWQDDIPQFNVKMIEGIAEGVHAGRARTNLQNPA